MKQNKLVKLSNYKAQDISFALSKIIEGYVTHKELKLGNVYVIEQVKNFTSMIDNETMIHERNNESLDKICEILRDILKKEETTEAERIEIYKLLGEIGNIHKESQIQKSKHVTSRIVSAMGIAGSVAITLGTCFIYQKYKTER